MFEVIIKPKAKKVLKRIRDKEEKKIIYSILFEIKKNPFLGKKLKGKYQGSYSYRVWPFRILYEIDKKLHSLVVYRIGHRGSDIYR